MIHRTIFGKFSRRWIGVGDLRGQRLLVCWVGMSLSGPHLTVVATLCGATVLHSTVGMSLRIRDRSANVTRAAAVARASTSSLSSSLSCSLSFSLSTVAVGVWEGWKALSCLLLLTAMCCNVATKFPRLSCWFPWWCN